ncbi:hypothetical protein EST38_g6019 [Candolleomyces aberdarensis]|uniref:F-box domain-containing protein n=1 Tax=Candolleomyces aberdarensis TaxID=2316362 RepID=A0A4Q2DM42_9AGAR|nr:hypothetical protein EST38_g6019 [Candolleomyces aberdarensis]
MGGSKSDSEASPAGSVFRRLFSGRPKKTVGTGKRRRLSLGNLKRSVEALNVEARPRPILRLFSNPKYPSTAAKQRRTLRRKSSTASTASTASSTFSTVNLAPFWLPPELWIYIFHLASSPSHPFLSSSILSTPEDLAKPISFLSYPHSHSHLLPAYKRMLRFKCTLTMVCKLWNALAQEVLFEFVWITRAREAECLAGLLQAKAVRALQEVPEEQEEEASAKKKKGKRRSYPVPQPLSDTTHFDYDNKGAYTYPYDTRGVGRHIRRLHIETTSSLNRCSPQDLLVILDHAPLLQVFSDYRSIKRVANFEIWSGVSVGAGAGGSRPSSSSGIVGSGSSVSVGSSSSSSPPSPSSSNPSTVALTTPSTSSTLHPYHHSHGPDHPVLSALLAHPKRITGIRRLSWTNYDYEPSDYEAGVRFYLRVVGPKLRMAREHLEFLEVNLCAKDLSGGGASPAMGGGGFLDGFLSPQGVNANNLTDLNATLLSTSVTTVTTSSSSPSSLSHQPSLPSLSNNALLSLPALRSLKVTLDNATFHVLSTWEMPQLQNLSVVSADFSYTGEGFARFFEVHGGKIRQLELGHSSGAIEEFWLTAPPHAAAGGQANGAVGQGVVKPKLAEWCPNLIQFICSADAEWNWQNPDWIAPHVLLPSHPTLQFIGVRDLEKHITESLERLSNFDAEHIAKGGQLYSVNLEETGTLRGDDAFFMLVEQFRGGLLSRESFPGLLYVRDMSWESEEMRRRGWVGLGDSEKGRKRESFLPHSALQHGRRGSSSSGALGMGMGLDAGVGSTSRPILGFFNFLRIPSPSSSPQDSDARRRAQEESERQHQAYVRKRELQQGRRVLRLWMTIMEICKERGVWLENCEGVNVTVKMLLRAEKDPEVDGDQEREAEGVVC